MTASEDQPSTLLDSRERTVLNPARQHDQSTLAKDLMDQLLEKIEPHNPGCHCPFCDAFDALGRAL